MKKLRIKVATLLVVIVGFSSCTVILPVTISNAEIGEKRGESKSIVIFGTYLNPKYGIKDAANDGNITSAIATIDEKTTNFIFFSRKILIVTAK